VALFALTDPLPPPPLQLSALQAEDKARVAAKEEEEREKEPKTWKERFYVQHLDALLDQRFQWPQETFMYATTRHRSLLLLLLFSWRVLTLPPPRFRVCRGGGGCRRLRDLRHDSPTLTRIEFLHILRRFDLACLKEICRYHRRDLSARVRCVLKITIGCRRLYDVDQSGAETLPRVTLVERITEAFFQGKIANFDKIIDSIHERKARVKGHCPFEPY
jgi:hypothetical protein